MGLISRIFSGGVSDAANAVTDVAEVFRPNAEASAQRASDQSTGARGQYAAEFAGPERKSWFNSLVDGLNRLPRPMMAFGAIGLIVYAMADPVGFTIRMKGLDAVPQELWWLLGAVVSFYFGARELKYARAAKPARQIVQEITELRTLEDEPNELTEDDNPALAAWKSE